MNDQRKQADSRRGGVLVCVLVVLLLVGMLSAQAFQTLAAARHGDRQRDELRQARELIELARLVAVHQAGSEGNRPQQIEFNIRTKDGQLGEVRIDSFADGLPLRYRIVAKLNTGTDRQTTVTYQNLN